ncbi:MAG: glycine cleavage system aminomethyltransferase GcvT [Actinomycetota bacterium]|nr:glycine cleavage system aminomethyltransferase GcvT [Actinomycetota bacterium]
MATETRSSALLDVHKTLGARLTDFAGWQMPLQYKGVIAEHNAVRTGVGVFDVSHLGKLRVSGADAGEALQEALTADVIGLEAGRASYSLVLTEEGGVVDDVFVYRLGEREWMVVPNAANVEAVSDAIRRSGGDVEDEWARWAILAIQGPRSFSLFERAFPGSGAPDLELHGWCHLTLEGEKAIVARTGYTGERGFELYAPASTAVTTWRRLTELGATPAGLGARDTLRLEMGYALYGHELSLDINPLEAGLGWAIAWDKSFRGRDALIAIKERGPARRLFGVRCTDKGVPRAGYRVVDDDVTIGTLTSGNYSPTLGTGIALGLGQRAAVPDPGARVDVDARGRMIGGDIVKPPFIKR